MTEFFRHCPECGRRFHIKLMGRDLVGTEEETVGNREIIMEGLQGVNRSDRLPLTTMHEGPVKVIEREKFRYAYKCGHCGHQWAEIHVKKAEVADAAPD